VNEPPGWIGSPDAVVVVPPTLSGGGAAATAVFGWLLEVVAVDFAVVAVDFPTVVDGADVPVTSPVGATDSAATAVDVVSAVPGSVVGDSEALFLPELPPQAATAKQIEATATAARRAVDRFGLNGLGRLSTFPPYSVRLTEVS